MPAPNTGKQAVRNSGVFRHRLAASISAEIRQLRELAPTQEVARAVASEVQLLQRAFDILSIPKLKVAGRAEKEHLERERPIRAMDAGTLWGDLLGEK